ncbi:MAG: hypothetical protein BWZ02_01773 [Lentisphaerae bacterium ADurb.BinA184]|nr:MAG: hypothetical protein BWZ02_01773 [Lentisphaerae bacterium ADurb.BinA184]
MLYTDEWIYAPVGPERQRQLFAARTDPGAETDVAARHPDLVRDLHQRLIAWLQAVGAPPEALAALRDGTSA